MNKRTYIRPILIIFGIIILSSIYKYSGLSPHLNPIHTLSPLSIKMKMDDNKQFKNINYNDSLWTRYIDDSTGIFWIRVQFDIKKTYLEKEIPQGLHIEFLASYEVFVNGNFIGKNGQPSHTKSDEIMGNLIHVTPVNAKYLQVGKNVISIRASNFGANNKIRLWNIRLGNYSDLVSNPIIFTSLVQVLTGILLGLFLYISFEYLKIKNKQILLLSTFTLLVLFLIVLEYLKFHVHYAYSLHYVRLKIIFGITLIISILSHFIFFNFFKSKIIWSIFLPYFVVFLYSLIAHFSYDFLTLLLLNFFILINIYIILLNSKNKSETKYELIFSLIPLFTMYFYYDISIFLALTYFIWSIRKIIIKEIEFTHKVEPTFLTIKEVGHYRKIIIDDICYIKGAKQYSEVVFKTGTTELLNFTLDKMLDQLPKSFVRIHKSYIINSKYSDEILLQSGGKYSLKLSSDDKIPIGRTYYLDVKKNLFP